MPDTTLEAGSPAERAATFLAANPDEVLDRSAAAAKLGIAPGAVDKALQPAVDLALITIANSGDLGRVWRAGPRLKQWAPAASAPAAKPKKAQQGGARNYLPKLDVAALKVRTDAPLPESMIGLKGRGRHDHVFDQLTADGMSVLGIPADYQPALAKAAQSYLANRPAIKATSVLYVRRAPDGTVGVWRLARATADALGEPRKPRAVQQRKA